MGQSGIYRPSWRDPGVVISTVQGYDCWRKGSKSPGSETYSLQERWRLRCVVGPTRRRQRCLAVCVIASQGSIVLGHRRRGSPSSINSSPSIGHKSYTRNISNNKAMSDVVIGMIQSTSPTPIVHPNITRRPLCPPHHLAVSNPALRLEEQCCDGKCSRNRQRKKAPAVRRY